MIHCELQPTTFASTQSGGDPKGGAQPPSYLRAFAFACLDFDAAAPAALLQAWFALDETEKEALAAASPLAARHLFSVEINYSTELEIIIPSGNPSFARAARGGHLACLRYLLDDGGDAAPATLCSIAAEHGQLACLALAHERGCFWDEYTCKYAALNGHLACLTYAHERGCPWDEPTCYDAAYTGHLDCLRYAHENGCKWDSRACERAALNGHLDCLRYAHERGCDWDKDTCFQAAYNGHLDCLRYAHENGCNLDSRTCDIADRRGHRDCLAYARAHGAEA